ncbi:phosphotransferase [Actinoalloteichus caeruleus]
MAQPVGAPDPHNLVHGDLHLSNLLWSEADEVTLLDF